ncbi:MAG: hypothetical protein U0R65_15925 [Candidatus Nanopelagicales bacterium]
MTRAPISVAAAVVLGIGALTACSAAPAPQAGASGTSAATSASSSPAPKALSDAEHRSLCGLVYVAAYTTFKYYKHTMNNADPDTIQTVVDTGNGVLAGHSDAEVLGDEVAAGYIGWRSSLVEGFPASDKALTTWTRACRAAGAPVTKPSSSSS